MVRRFQRTGFCAMPFGWWVEKGYRLVNVDATVILERPKLKDYRLAIRQNLPRFWNWTSTGCLSSSDRGENGPVGEGRSAEAQAVATIAGKHAA